MIACTRNAPVSRLSLRADQARLQSGLNVFLSALNLLNNQKPIAWDTTVTADNAGAKDANGLPLSYIKGANFGNPTSTTSYARPRPGMDGGRTFIAAFGIRF